MTIHHNDESDDRLAELFAATAADAPQPDHAALAALRERSTAEFAALHSRDQWSRGGKFAVRSLIALAATAAVLMAGFFLSRLALDGPPPVAQLTFGEVMQNLAKVTSYRAQLVEEDGSREVLGRADAFRIETTPTEYSIVTADRIWHIDENDNRATGRDWQGSIANTPTFDPLRIWDLSSSAVASLLATEKRLLNGREQLVFYGAFKSGENLEAVVDAGTGLPTYITRTGTTSDGRLTPVDLRFVAFNQPLDESKLKVAATLTQDGRIGKVTQWQGNVALRPMTSTRWTPVCDQPILRLGDWLRTDFQGANAVTVQLAPQTTLILGPGSLAQFTKPDQITLHAGFAEITPAAKSDNFSGIVKLTGPNNSTLDVGGVALVRTNDQGLVTSDKPPVWLAGYKGTAVRESLGSLLALIDGRRVPLTVGYHKVSVEIRDQIARTTIEESFVNHTSGVLEGQFHFPLPADASISGFGMWIGDKLVEADVVEKQRAREIYETILREKRDPGLLEWTGGNLFKARVYPIPANGEKRIKIVYTQVLPRKGDSYRYSYALQSDLLRQNPLRQLDLEVTVSSTQPLAGVTCPTHQTRNQATEHAARVEFSAQKYTPTRDFEVVVRTAGETPDVVFIPHRRGDDGYFLLQLQPPADGDGWQRDVLPSGDPLHLLVLADTSASMDAASRQTQAQVLAALLGSLSPQDTFNLAACDVDCTWTFDEPQQAEEKAVLAAREQLAKRRLLGWTNLDRAIESLAEKVKQGTQVVYLGDGIVTTGDMDGPAFVQRMQRQLGGKGATLHAVAVSSSYDAAVLRGMAAIGGGSLRSVSGEIGPQQTAKDLLAEITRPALRNIQLEFKGLQTARVYPRVLPNVPAGTQQIVLGRYLPEGSEQRGEVIVTGTLDGKPVTYRTGFRAQGAEVRGQRSEVGGQNAVASLPAPNPQPPAPSFIPRLWARLHLDELLAQGTSQEIQDEIINLSEEFHLITPYTSLLVLETDADRERFKVKRRFLMSDGERFFAQARDTAQYQLVQQQMQRASLWRLELRQSVLSSLSSLGRDREEIDAIRADVRYDSLLDSISNTVTPDSWLDVSGPGSISGFSSDLSLVVGQTQEFAGGGESWGGGGYGMGGMGGMLGDAERPVLYGDMLAFHDRRSIELSVAVNGGITLPAPLVYDPMPNRPGLDTLEAAGRVFGAQKLEWLSDGASLDFKSFSGKREEIDGRFRSVNAFEMAEDADDYVAFAGEFLGKSLKRLPRSREDRLKSSLLVSDSFGRISRRSSLPALLPIGLAAPAKEIVAPAPPEVKSLWPEEAQRVAGLLKQKINLTQLAGALVMQEQHDSYDDERGRIDSRASTWRLASAKAWLVRETGDSSGPTVNWATADQRGVLSVPYELALVRKSAPTDFPQEIHASEYWQGDLVRLYADRLVRVEKPQAGQSLLVLSEPLRPEHESRILIDEARGVALSIEHFQHGQPQGGSRASDFVQIAGVWLPKKVEHFNEHGRNNNVFLHKYEVVAADQIAGLIAEQLAPKAAALTLHWPLPKLQEAKERIAKGQATLEDRLRLLIDLAGDQKWPEATAELARCEELLGNDKTFAPWLRLWHLQVSRRNEDLKQQILAQAKSLAEQPRAGEFALALHLLGAGDSLSAEERLAVLDVLKPIYARLPEHLQGPRLWGERRRNELANATRGDEETALLRELVRDYPDRSDNIRALADRLANQGDYVAAYEVLHSALARPDANWPARNRDELYDAWAGLLHQQGRYAEQATLVAQWLKLKPTDSDPYQRYLAALIYTRRETLADQLLSEWLAAGLAAERLDEATIARTEAAIRTVLGDNNYVSGGDPDLRFLQPLLALVEQLVDREDGEQLASLVSNEYELRKRDEFRLLGQRLLARLKENAGNYAPARLQRLVDWVISYVSDVPDADWQAIAAAIRRKWETAPHPVIGEAYAETLLRVLGQIGESEKLAFLRERLEKSDEAHRGELVRRLFATLLEAEWSAEIQAESLALIDKLAPGEPADQRLREQVVALHRWTDRMEEARQAELDAAIERPDKLTSTELEAKKTELRQQVRRDLAARLKAAAATRSDGLKKWLLVEQLYLEVRQEHELAKVVESAWELLGLAPPPARPLVEDQSPSIADELDAALRARLVTMLIGLATRKDALPAEIERLHKYLDQTIAADATDAPDNQPSLDARMAKYVLLVALDKPQELAELLTQWSSRSAGGQSARGASGPHWQRSLAYLKAELGSLEEAVTLMQPLVADDALDAADYRMLAAWNQALKRDEQSAAMQVAAWKQMDEWRLRDFIEMHKRPWENTNGPSPGAVDPQVFLALQALFEKSSEPAQHVDQVRSFYEKSRDFRLLAGLADAVVGQSSGSIYTFLKACDSALDVLDREATADELLAHLAKVRERAKTPVDQRALDLLEMLVERRAAELQNQAGLHVAAAVAALQRATKHEWSPGEPRLFAQLLADLRAINPVSGRPLAAERVHMLGVLHEAAQRQPQDRLAIAHALAESLRDDGQRQPAIDAIESALAEHLQASGGQRTSAALDSLSLLSDLYSRGGQYIRAEQVVRSELPRAANPSVAFDLTVRLQGVHISALQENGATSYGQGQSLYRGVRDELIAAAAQTPDSEQRRRLVEQLCRLLRTAKDHTPIDSVAADAAAFGQNQFAVLIDRQIDNHQEMVGELGRTIHHVAGPRQALAFYLARIETEPSWLVRKGDDGWREFAHELASLSQDEAVRGKLGELEPRLLAIVLRALRHELTTFDYHQRHLYHDDYSYFWKEKTDDFARVAEETLAGQRDSLQATRYIADYLYEGLDRHDRAIAVLLDANRRGVLDENGQSRLVVWLQEQKRWGESIGLLEPLVKLQPDDLNYRVRLMHAYFQTKQPEALQTLLTATDKHFHEEDRWSESVAGQLAAGCLENLLLEPAIEYLKEAIGRRAEALNQQTTGDQTLAQYYVERAYAYAGMNNTPAAVEDAASAIVVWGAAGEGIARRNVRTGQWDGNVHPLDVLREVLAQSPNLDAYVAELDKAVAAENQDRPIIRKAIGDVYYERSAFEKAIAQYELVVELAPGDGAIHAQLFACYDALMQDQQAAEQLFASVELARRDIDLWVKLAQQLDKLGLREETERARTSIVEMLPTESESHAKLAEVRQGQDRWQDAAYHWQQVARIRKLEPAGLLGVAGAQIHLQQRAAAENTLKELETTDWPERFDKELAEKHLPKLREELSKLPK